LNISGSFSRTQFAGAQYDDTRAPVTTSDVAGSISLSNVRIQAAKGSLLNNNTKEVEFLNKQSARKTIFDGTYTAQKQDVYLNGFSVVDGTNDPASDNLTNQVTYYLSIDGKEVASFDYVLKSVSSAATSLSKYTEDN
jgi:Flp pilus assembly protein TadG